jgi:hypothetical protein
MLLSTTRVLALSAIVAIGTGTFGSTSADAAAARHASPRATSAATPPATEIEGSGSALTWVPSTLVANVFTGTCSATRYSILITNTTSKTQTVTRGGIPIGSPIPPGQNRYFCYVKLKMVTDALKADATALLKIYIGPNTKIEGSGSVLHWAPDTLSAKLVTTECLTYSFIITNTTTTTQRITQAGTVFDALPAHDTAAICVTGPTGTFTFALRADPSALLSVTIT